ncbi:MAG: hypothetical protein SP1CHLAM54_05500 [Chlamydiia bacterium]|nr:hypothetical protein [Chlamydiia bacterium]MCH9615460.1 hypothetical protein [Chlamydiia bacterium]MCH9629115.1 hypothetical protein [Chlamydiia bacterium]
MKRCAFVFTLLATSLFGAVQTDLLFFLVDAGETHAILPVLEKLESFEKDYIVLAHGTAKDIVYQSGLPPQKIMTFAEFGIELDPVLPRMFQLTSPEVKKISSRIQALMVVSGVASAMQGQILEAYTKKDVMTVSYWDNFSATGTDAYFEIGHKVARKASMLFFPTKDVAEDLSFNPVPVDKRMVVGQPSLEGWKEINSYDRHKLLKKISGVKNQKRITYIGGYGKEYEEAFTLFLKSMGDRVFSSYHVIIAPHPKTDGSFEKEMVKKQRSLLPEVTVLSGELTTKEATSLSDLVVCHKSTAGFQAASAGKSVIYLIPQTQEFSNTAIEKDAAKCVHSPSSFKKTCLDLMENPSGSFHDKVGVPEGSSEVFFHALLYYVS